jgi:hypothetical protein
MPDEEKRQYANPREEDIMAGDRRISRPDSALPDWYISDAKYRPIPIAWFAAAILIQTIVISAMFFLLITISGWFTLLLAVAVSAGVLLWSWDRGIGRAGPGWQFATVAVMLMQLGFITVGVSDRL